MQIPHNLHCNSTTALPDLITSQTMFIWRGFSRISSSLRAGTKMLIIWVLCSCDSQIRLKYSSVQVLFTKNFLFQDSRFILVDLEDQTSRCWSWDLIFLVLESLNNSLMQWSNWSLCPEVLFSRWQEGQAVELGLWLTMLQVCAAVYSIWAWTMCMQQWRSS
jgi:hypothetical protein